MNARNYLWWAVAILFLIAPPLLVRILADGSAIRIIAYCGLLIAMTAFCLYLGLNGGVVVADMPIAKDLKSDESKKLAEVLFRGLPLVIVIAGLWMLAGIAPSLLVYESGQSPAASEVDVISHVDSAAVPGAFYIHMSIQTSAKSDLSFWYPDQILQAGHKYIFTILPNSNFILSARPDSKN
jgi:hypothetical protein